MNAFVEECRDAWRRLGVPHAVADEMAAELAADLAEAEAEGVAAADVLGSDARDARSFASSWAAARGVVPPRRRHPRGTLAAAMAVLALLAAAGGAVVLLAAPSASKTSAVAPRPTVLPTPIAVRVDPPNGGRAETVVATHWRIIPAAAPPVAGVVPVETDESGPGARRVGWALLLVGLSGLVSVAASWLWSTRARRSSDALAY